ncbi:hypothetical protein PhCBS80983_g01131 [Powellomyces hirtus]|uniref:Urease accessory protein UreF n=1 Tax=Powellomyces hirtus TaxID=109895 RepID=A0A507EEE9_9FUNG|nr:hypothetical protein PhCBS80983_g01131 [Powellomyces hirtus]
MPAYYAQASCQEFETFPRLRMAATALRTREDWLLCMISDSALPTGGFVSSGGLEAAVQAGHVTSSSLLAYMNASVHSYAHSGVPYVRAAWQCLEESRAGEGIDLDGIISKLTGLDHGCDVLTGTNHIARRASRAQGAAYLTLAVRGFPTERGIVIVKAFKTEVRASRTPGHLVLCFAIVCWCLGIPLDRTEHLLVFLYVRSLLSAAIRLNLVGPYQGQQLLLALQKEVEHALRLVQRRMEGHHIPQQSLAGPDTISIAAATLACQTSPVVDILQGLHGQLYSRMFNS